MRLRLGSSVLLAATLCWPASVRADAIDGDWCSEETGKRISIKGPAVVTPGGTMMQGDYTRHSFSYTAPVGEAAAGQKVEMVLLNETNVQVRSAGSDLPPSVWHRCTGTTS